MGNVDLALQSRPDFPAKVVCLSGFEYLATNHVVVQKD